MNRPIFLFTTLVLLTQLAASCEESPTSTAQSTTLPAAVDTRPATTSVTDPEKMRPPRIRDYCWNAGGTSGEYNPGQPPVPFLYQPFEGQLNGDSWTSQIDHDQPTYQHQPATSYGKIATLGESLQYSTHKDYGLAGGTEVYAGGSRKWFSHEETPQNLISQGYQIFAYQSPTYETYMYYDGHDGHDFAIAGNALAAADGKVVFTDTYGDSLGRVVEIYHPQGYLTRYAHLASFADGLIVGQPVKAGQPIGTIGGSAVVNRQLTDGFWGTHLHFGVFHWNSTRGEWEVTDPFGWDPWAGPDMQNNLKKQLEDPLYTCNGEISYNIWAGGWPQPVDGPAVVSFNPSEDRYVGGWLGDLPESPSESSSVDLITGKKIVFVSDRDGNSEIYMINSDGTGLTNLTNNPASDTNPTWAPDGRAIAFISDRSGISEIFLMRSDGTEIRQLTSLNVGLSAPMWAPDGKRIGFSSIGPHPQGHNVYWLNSDGSSLTKVYDASQMGGDPTVHDVTWSADSQQLIFSVLYTDPDRGDFSDLWSVNLDGSDLRLLTSSPLPEDMPAVSPSGGQLVFVRRATNQFTGLSSHIFMMGVGGNEYNITENLLGSCCPQWSRDGTKLAFVATLDRVLYVIDYSTGQFTAVQTASFSGGYAWSPDSGFLTFSDGSDIYKVAIDGSGLVNLTEGTGYDTTPSWQPGVVVESEPPVSPDILSFVGTWEGTGKIITMLTLPRIGGQGEKT